MNNKDYEIAYNIIAAVIVEFLGINKNNYWKMLKNMKGLNNFIETDKFIKEYLTKICGEYTPIIKF